ncbi:peroxisome biosynthesis protein PAS1 [Xylona heveae TC161]|uniref:Peroxisomal ATPase PEX1 n=1 Tax=Xylona heveae (strain CBS 132557 / TC161) TaxID=1328760 RepID=A0A165JZ82_XYLHT|nr:peroxisome biosynthesis protein PAS1 [Xylona heveae TC161]KZF26815.1 peroxisome biosynthesis protein PAS1 [Xylona heveae TC161]
MAPAARKSAASSTSAEIAFLSQLKSCLVNLPSTLVGILVNANTAAQNVIVELSFRQQTGRTGAAETSSQQRSVYVGWTGMPSKRKAAPVITRDGLAGGRHSGSVRDQDIALVEIDATLGRLLGLEDGQKVGITLHLDPPLVRTVNIEPLTTADWEMIELHATFLELNLLSQIRALPNPSFEPPNGIPPQQPHPLSLHLSPTSTASIRVLSLTPSPPSSSPFAKIAPDAEVIVAPKVRQRQSRGGGRDSQSVASAGGRSVSGRSAVSAVRQRNPREEPSGKGALFFRGVDRDIAMEYFDDEPENGNEGLKVWVDKDALFSKALKGSTWVSVSVVQPAGIRAPNLQSPGQAELGSTKPTEIASKVVARILPWLDGPDTQHAVLSTPLCEALRVESFVGGIIRIEAAPPQTPKGNLRSLTFTPFSTTSSRQGEGLKFGGQSQEENEEVSRKLKSILGPGPNQGHSILEGPITDGLYISKSNFQGESLDFDGGILRFEPQTATSDPMKAPCAWALGSERSLHIEIRPEVLAPPATQLTNAAPDEALPERPPHMVGIDKLIDQILGHLSHSSSVLLTGGLGCGKTSLTHLLSHELRQSLLYHATYFPCKKLVTEETRVSTIKESLNALFMTASWGARLGGRSLVVLDDVDKLCPVETELQVGGENGRSRQISEIVCSIVKQYCSMESGVVLLATAQAKESVNNLLVSNHVVREIISLKAPDKEGRRKVLEMLVAQDHGSKKAAPDNAVDSRPPSSQEEDGMWMDGLSTSSRRNSSDGAGGFVVEKDIDFLDLAGKTDGYMPGDLVLLVSRARSEALIRSIVPAKASSDKETIKLGIDDFTRALQGFTPASLRNVSLQSSTTTFDSIGGLHYTRQTLLETLQYPTTYAPIFAQCPLRLRSGLLLYGYPGCGKTLLASAVAGECGLNFISVKGPEILNKYIGASEKSVRDLFERAQAARPCVLFFDEFDSIAPKRGHDSTGVTDRVVNQLLTQMDGAEGLSGVYVLAATSRPDLIDPALLRPGRLDKSLICDLPSFEDRLDILKAFSKKIKISENILHGSSGHGDFHEVARRTEGYSGADLQAVVYNAHLEAIHDVLDADEEKAGNSKQKKRQEKPSRASAQQDFIQFRFAEGEDEDVSVSSKRSQAASRAAIIAKLDALKQARRHQRQLADPGSQGRVHESAAVSAPGNVQHESTEVVVHWKHLAASLATTRSSISSTERMRLAAIYNEFVVGRNGEMPSGQAPTEIGGRSSLM